MVKLRNGEQVFKSVCRICHGGCGVLVFVKDGKVVRVKGDPASPMNKGWMCVKGVMTPEIANHPDRLRKPLRRKGRGVADNGRVSPGTKFLGKLPLDWTNSAKNLDPNLSPWGREPDGIIICMW